MRGCLLGSLGTFGGIAVFFLSIFLGLQTQSWIVFFICLAGGIGLIVLLGKAGNEMGRTNMDSWLSSLESCNYKYAWDGSGIAIDTTNKMIHLSSDFNKQSVSKAYSFSDVREWGYEMPGTTVRTAGTVIGGGIQGASHNLGAGIGTEIANAVSRTNAMENTGLWLVVKDIDFPKRVFT